MEAVRRSRPSVKVLNAARSAIPGDSSVNLLPPAQPSMAGPSPRPMLCIGIEPGSALYVNRSHLRKKKPPVLTGGFHWWRRRDSFSISFEKGWTMPSSCLGQDAERVIRSLSPDPSARSAGWRQRVYESLQGRPEVGLLPTPRRCHAVLRRLRVHRCELRFHFALSGKCDLP